MLIFLTLIYVGFLAMLVKLQVIRLTLFWKLSPLLWMVFLFVVLFIPMQWGAPSGPVNVYSYVVEVIPNVSGEVIEVEAEGLVPMKKGDVLFRINPVAFQADVDRLEASLAEVEQQVPQLKAAFDARTAEFERAEAERDLAKMSYDRAQATSDRDKGAVSELRLDQTRQAMVAAEAAVRAAAAEKERSLLAYQSEIDGENTRVAQLRAELRAAKQNLDYTVVRAPADGFVFGATLRPGQRVANLPVRSWMAFVTTDRIRVVVAVKQYALRHIKSGQKAEVTLALHPGKMFGATVEDIGLVTPNAQMQPSGVVDYRVRESDDQEPFGVVLTLDEGAPEIAALPGGALGSAAIYTDQMKATHIIRKVMMRMTTWMNYVIPS